MLAPLAAVRCWARYQSFCGPVWKPRLWDSPAVLNACADVLSRSSPTPSAARQQADTSSKHGCSLDLCVGVVRFTTKTGRDCQGLCSSFFRDLQLGDSVRCSLEPGSLSLPHLDVPLILVCPGTGLSPCRALVQQRHLEIAGRGGSTNCGRFAAGLKDLMFLGFRHQAGDYLYGTEWDTFSSWLSVNVAFSRDHEDKKVYVQDVIEENGAAVCKLLDAGARIFVCGRSHPMPGQVFDSFCEVLRDHCGISFEDAHARLREMQRSQRYICDTWG